MITTTSNDAVTQANNPTLQVRNLKLRKIQTPKANCRKSGMNTVLSL